MKSTIVIIGGGQAGAQAVDTLRKEGFAGRLILVGDEAQLPYQRPPLSKKFLSGELAAERLPLRHRSFYEEHAVELLLDSRAVRIDAASRTVALESGAILPFDALLLCLGAAPGRLACPGADLAGIHHLRTLADASSLRRDIEPGARAVVIGGGYIGLEAAATFRRLGCEVTVLEMTDRVMSRVVAPEVSDFFTAAHRTHGVEIVCATAVAALEGAGRVERVVCADGRRYDADLVLVGVGSVPVTALAADAGLPVGDGILVDEYCRTADPAIFAAGDCTNFPSPHYGVRVRLESVDNAFEQAKAAALNMLDRGIVYDRVPWFWSDQYEHKLLIVGLSSGHDQRLLRADPATGGFSVCYLRNRELIALEAVDDSKSYMAARKLIDARVRLDPSKVGDARVDLKAAV